MKRTMHPLHLRLRAFVLALLVPLLLAPTFARAQDQPPQRVTRTYVPPDQLVSFLPATPFNQFIEFINPIFARVTGKQVIDPESRIEPIGMSIAGMHFLDAFEMILATKELAYRETDRFFIIEEAVPPDLVRDAESATGRAVSEAAVKTAAPAALDTREIQISAILFEANVTRARQLGIDWNVFFGSSQQQGGTGGGGGGGGGQEQERPIFRLKTDQIFEPFEDILDAPQTIQVSTLTQFFRLLEDEGLGETIASPQVTVQSGEEGLIQIGSDVPIQTRDFAGNTITQFFSTGIIINVTPTLVADALADTAGSPTFEFIHLDVAVEKSSGRPSAAGTVIDRNLANTQVLLLDGEQTVIGGLYSTDESVSRRGIPLLKDLPWWFFGLRYIFGYTTTTVSQKELLIVLQANVRDPLQVRANQPFRDRLIEDQREQVRQRLGRVSPELPARVPEVESERN